MKPILEDISNNLLRSSFYAYSYTTTAFDFKWHFHPEYELTYIIKGNGYRLIGNSHQEFFDDDFVLIGPNLPHTWFGKAEENENFEAIVIQLPADFVQRILAFKESDHLKELFDKSNCGLLFKEFPVDIKQGLLDLINAKGIERVIRLLRVISELSFCQTTSLSSKIYKYQINEEMENKINKVCLFLQENFLHHVSLKEVADLLHMTESNFCKFFKKSTGITFSNYIHELRINAACKLLLHSDNNIKSIAYASGFESLSYFNRVFLKKKHVSPKEFRIKHLIT
ncbi:MAG: AraC family transcriptional regulator [Chryseotalea sp.]|jgi:AraC-like DNA-binding protein